MPESVLAILSPEAVAPALRVLASKEKPPIESFMVPPSGAAQFTNEVIKVKENAGRADPATMLA